MDDLAFWAKIAEILGSFAWPAVLVTVPIVYRDHVGGLFARLQEFTLPGGAKAVFEKQLERAGEKAEKIEPRCVTEPPQMPAADDPYLTLAKNFPEAAILQEFKEIELLLYQGGEYMPALNQLTRTNLSKVARWLLDDDAYQLFRSLRDARNAAAHAAPHAGAPYAITPAEALEYRDKRKY